MFLTKDRSPEVRECIEAIARADTDLKVNAEFQRLNDVLAAEALERAEAARERRRETGMVHLAPEGAAEAAADMFAEMREEAIAAAAGEAEYGDGRDDAGGDDG